MPLPVNTELLLPCGWDREQSGQGIQGPIPLSPDSAPRISRRDSRALIGGPIQSKSIWRAGRTYASTVGPAW
jgi:hypothetical protein